MLDLSTAMKVSQIISSEIVLNRLLQMIMHESITNAAHSAGYLILESDGGLTIEASEDVVKNESLVLQSLALKDCPDICHSIRTTFITAERISSCAMPRARRFLHL